MDLLVCLDFNCFDCICYYFDFICFVVDSFACECVWVYLITCFLDCLGLLVGLRDFVSVV